MSTEAAAPTKMTLNFSLPHETIYAGAEVAQVIIPGLEGEYGVTVNHVPTVSQLKAGVLQIMHEEGQAEKYFVAGGYALTHENSVTVSKAFILFIGIIRIQKLTLFVYSLQNSKDITCPEAVKLDDLDSAAIQKNYDAAKSAYSAAEAGSVAQAEADIEIETNKAMATAIGLAL
jgi:F0F1-type ATP synthase epsilon subunit